MIKNIRAGLTFTVAVLLGMAGCAMPRGGGGGGVAMMPSPAPPGDAGTRNYLEKGPTLVLGESRGDGPSPLEKIELISVDLQREREDASQLREALRRAQTERDEIKAEYSRLNTMYSDMRHTMDLAETAQMEILEKVLVLKLEKVRLEKEVLQLKLEQLAAEASR